MDSNEKSERELYIEKLENLQEVIGEVLRLGSGSVLSLDIEENLEKLRKTSKLLAKKLRNDEYEVAIVGMEKAGKSTFANALMENQFLPAKDARCTFTSTRIEYNDEDRDDYAKVTFYSTEVFDKDFKDKLKKLGIEDADKYSFKNLKLEQYQQLYEKDVSEEKKTLYGDNLNEDIISILQNQSSIKGLLDESPKEIDADENGIKKLERFITEPNTAYAVKEVIIKSKKLEKMKNAVIFDVPGFNSPTELHKIQTKKRMEEADAIIVVANGEHPSITGESLKILRESDRDGSQLSDKLFVFANRIGLAKDIEQNKRTTYSEWITDKKILSSSNKHRIIFGSALAHIVKLFSPEDYDKENEFKKLESLEHGDGIDAMREALIAYNRNERFSVLKTRINKIDSEIHDILVGLNGKYDKGANYKSLSPEHQRAFGHFIGQARQGIVQKLEEYREEIRNKMYENYPLTKRIRDYIDKNITKEKYSITKELINKYELGKIYDGNQDVSKIESRCREELFTKMFTKDFSDNVLSIADDFHKDCSEKIIEAIMTGMGVDKSSFNYEEIKGFLRQELVPFRKEFAPNDESYEKFNMYESLIQRFTRDIFELLIASNYTFERLDRFYERISNCLSLSIFYKKKNDTDDFTYLNVTPQEQPLWKMILFHHYLTREEDKVNLKKSLADLAGLNEDFTDLRNGRCSLDESKEVKEDSEIKVAIEKVLDSCCGKIENVVEDIKREFRNVTEVQDYQFRINRLKMLLNRRILKNEACMLSDKKNFKSYYTKYHNDTCNGEYTTDYVCKEFDKDVEILRDILINGCVNAINLEKPFVARETRTIDRIKDYIQSNEKFVDFLNDHFREIRWEENKALDAENAIRENNAAIANAISSYLEKLNS